MAAVILVSTGCMCTHAPRAPELAGRLAGSSGLHGSEVTKIRIQVPQEPNNFVGRERELTELCELLGVTRALTLCGPGGIGKTRLAQRVLHTVVAAFPDGGCFVDLGDLWQPDLVISRVASALGVGEEPGRPLLDTLADAVAAAPAAAGPGQLRAPDRRVRRGVPAPARRLAGADPDRHEPRAAAGGRGDGVAGTAAVGRAGRPAGVGRGREPVRGDPAVRRPGGRVPARFHHRPGQRRRGRRAVPGAGRRAAGDRTGGRAGARAVGGADRRAAGRPVRAAHHRQPDRPAAAQDPARHHRLEPRPAHAA